MVNLGLVKDFNSCPSDTPRLCFCPPSELYDEVPLLKSWTHKEEQLWELIIPNSSRIEIHAWIQNISQILQHLNKYQWCVNTHDLVHVFQLPLDKALYEWGRHFWPIFKFDSIFYFEADSDAQIIRDIFLEWEKKETNICYRKRYDLTISEPPARNAYSPETTVKQTGIFKNPLNFLSTGKNNQ